KPLRDPLTERSHQEVSAELVDTTAAVEADDAVAPGQQDDDRPCLPTPKEEHPLGSVGNRHIADRSGRCVCPSATPESDVAVSARRIADHLARRSCRPLAPPGPVPTYGVRSVIISIMN